MDFRTSISDQRRGSGRRGSDNRARSHSDIITSHKSSMNTNVTLSSRTPLLGLGRRTTSPQANSERSTPRGSRESLVSEVSRLRGTAVDANAQAEASPPGQSHLIF